MIAICSIAVFVFVMNYIGVANAGEKKKQEWNVSNV